MDDIDLEEKGNVKIVTNELLAKYIAELADDVKLTNANLREKAMMSSGIWAKWLSYLYKEKENLQRIQDMKQRTMQQKMSDVKQNDSILRLKSETKLQENDDTLKKLNELYKKTQTNIDYIEHALNILQNFGYSVKNAYEVLKLNMEMR